MEEKTKEIKDRIAKALSMRDMKPVDLVNKSGISKSAISQYMSGYAKPKQDRIYLIAKALDVSEAWLMGFDVPFDREPENITEEDAKLDARFSKDSELKEIVKIYYSLPEEKRAEIRRYVKFIGTTNL